MCEKLLHDIIYNKIYNKKEKLSTNLERDKSKDFFYISYSFIIV